MHVTVSVNHSNSKLLELVGKPYIYIYIDYITYVVNLDLLLTESFFWPFFKNVITIKNIIYIYIYNIQTARKKQRISAGMTDLQMISTNA